LCVTVIAWGMCAPPTWAQEPDEERGPAFVLSSAEVFTSRDHPSFYLTFRNLASLDFRVYKVRDEGKFFSGLRDPHRLGGRETPVPTERSWLERMTDWKRRQRSGIRVFFRDQVTYQYRAVRRASRDRTEIAQRVTLNEASFAQVPLLNPEQLVTAWRELLPNRRDSEMRRVPLAVTGHGVYLVEAVSGALRAYTIVMVSDVGLVTKIAPGEMLVFAANRITGEPAAGCDVQVNGNSDVIARGTTDADGVLITPLPQVASDTLVTLARCAGDVVVTDPSGYSLRQPSKQLVGYIYTDKPVYRPGHTVHLKAVLRWRDHDVLTKFDRPTAEVSVTDVNDKVVFRQSLPIDEFGAVQVSLPLPPGGVLGNYTVRVATGDQQALGSFEVQEYRRPEYEVIVTPASRFVVQGQDVVATVQARYYFGQPVANAHVRYVVNRQPYYSPLRYEEESEGEEGERSYFEGSEQNDMGELRLDAQGRGEIRIPTSVASTEQDFSLRIEAQATDASSREVSGDTTVHATYGSFLLTTRIDGYIFRPGQNVTTSIRAVDYVGQDRPSVPVTVVVERREYRYGYYREPTTVKVSESSITLDGNGRGDAQVTLGTEPGTYVIRAVATDTGRSITSASYAWIPGERNLGLYEQDRYLELVADKQTYAAGDIARLAVRGDQISGPVLITKEGQHVAWHRVARVAAGDPLEVPIESSDAGDIYVNIAYMRDGRLYSAERRLSVPPQDRTLHIELAADRPVAKPQEPGVFTVSVSDASGAPVKAQISLGVIDEAVYAVKPDETPDPIRFFYRREYSRVSTRFSRDYYFVGFAGSDRLQLARRSRRPFSLADFKGDKEVQPQVRKDFPDAIYWIGDLVTDTEGHARVSIKYPDALTTWRLTARAVTTDTLAGISVARTTTTKDLIVRLITPRFLTEGDQVVLPTIVHNYLKDSKDATIAIEASGLQQARGIPAAPVAATIAPAGEHRDDWRFVANKVGTASVTATAKTDSDSDAVELPVPVLPFGLRREAGTSGSLVDAGETTATVTIPSTANPAERSVRVLLAPSIAGSLLGAVDFLTSYPYGCTEQTLSSFLPNLVVTRALAQLKLAPTERLSALDRQVNEGLTRLQAMQNDDGGWGWWRTGPSHPFMTAYAVYGLAEARRQGYTAVSGRLQRGTRALAAMYTQNPRAEPDLKAYFAFVLGRAPAQGVSYRQADALNELWDARNRMSSYGRALLLLALDDAGDSRGNELATRLMGEAETQGDLSFWKSDRDPLLFDFVDTSVEATATAIRALARHDARSPVLDRAVRWLMLNRSGGYWYSTKQTAIALYGLLELLQARNETPRPFVADVYVNGTLAGSQSFTAASLINPDPIAVIASGQEGANSVRIVKRGGGTLYWSATSVYFDPHAAEARTGGRQLAIARTYALLSAVKRADGTYVYREQPLQGAARPGDVLTVRLTVAGSKDWRYLALEDPLPAGVEAIQDTTAYPLESGDTDWWWYGRRIEYRDSRTSFFLENFEEGRYEFVYLVKVVSSGQFNAVPAQIAPMYVPGVAASSEPFAVTVDLPAAGSQ
jgi:uncharacterized protein YfaS (alpha-2-macroglobulin family)